MKKKTFSRIFGEKGTERRVSVLAAVILIFSVLVTGGIIFFVLAQQLVTDLENGLVRTLNDKATLTQHEIESGEGRASSIANRRPRLSVLMSAINSGLAPEDTRRELDMALAIIRPDMKLSALALYDARGNLVSSSGEFLQAPFSVSLRQPENSALLWNDGFYLSSSAVMLQNGQIIGTVRVEYPLIAMTSAYLDRRGSGETGETVLCGALSPERMRCFPTRLHPQPFEVPRGGAVGKALPMSLAIEGKSGIVTEALDYRREKIFGAYRPVGDSGLGMAVKIDTRELKQPLLLNLLWIVPFLVALLAIGFSLLRWKVGPLVHELVSTRERVHGILDNSADGIITIDERGIVESYNYAAARIFGYIAAEVLGRSVNMLMPEAYRARHDEAIRHYLSTGVARAIGRGPREVEGQRKDGSIFPMDLNLGEMLLDGRRIFIASIRDASALKKAHDELKSSYIELQTTSRELEKAHVQLRQAELDNNRQMNALAEANVRMALYYATLERIHEADLKFSASGDMNGFFSRILSDVMSLTGAKYGAVGLFDADGRLQQFLTEGLSEEDRQKIGPYPVGKGLLEALYRGNALTRVARIADDPRSCGFPPNHPPMTSLLGAPLNVNGRTLGVIYLADKGNGEPFTDHDEMLLEMLTREVEHILERGELLSSLRVSNQALSSEKAEQQVLIEKLHEAQNQLLQSEKMASIGQLAAGVAHEINNPIGYVHSNLGSLGEYIQSLLGLVEAYEREEGGIQDGDALSRIRAVKKSADLEFLREDIASLLSESREGITRVKKIVQDLKDFSHVDEADWQWSQLHQGLDSTLNIVWNELKYKTEVIREYGDLPEVECIPAQLNQVFMNLLVNAGHAIETRGTITIRTGTENEQVWVEIADTGKGIAPEYLKRIFEPFFTTKPVGKGTGLGLSLSYNIIQKHHGRIEVASEQGKGTTFRIWLPIKHVED